MTYECTKVLLTQLDDVTGADVATMLPAVVTTRGAAPAAAPLAAPPLVRPVPAATAPATAGRLLRGPVCEDLAQVLAHHVMEGRLVDRLRQYVAPVTHELCTEDRREQVWHAKKNYNLQFIIEWSYNLTTYRYIKTAI